MASLLVDDIQLQKQTYHYFLGRPHEWADQDVPPTVAPILQTYNDDEIRRDALFFKKIGQNDVSLVTKRYDWQSDTIIPQWDNTLDMTDVSFYRITEYAPGAYNVYLCLDNAENSLQTIRPIGTQFHHFRTSDGYLWKFLYSIPSYKMKRFASSEYVPVQRALSDSFYSKGSIDRVVVTNSGEGYSSDLQTTIAVQNTYTGSGANIRVQSVDSFTGAITGYQIVSGGQSYTAGCGIRVVQASGTGINARLSPVITSGAITSLNIEDSGIGYAVDDTIYAEVGGMQIIPVLQEVGQIIDVKITNPGNGYASAPILTLSYTSGTPFGMYNGNPSAILEAVIANGQLQRVLIKDPGFGYPRGNATVISSTGDGTGAKFVPVIVDGKLTDVIVEDPGVGYNGITLTVVGTGAGAKCRATLQQSDYEQEQSIVEQTAVSGAIYSIKLTEHGEGYSDQVAVTVEGDGSGCVARAVIANGAIEKIVVDQVGKDYTYAVVTITDLLTAPSISAQSYIVLPPVGGHGKDAVQQLHANAVSIVSQLRDEAKLENFGQEYRQFGLIKNLRSYLSQLVFTGEQELQIFDVEFTSTEGLILDEVLSGNNCKYRVVAKDGVYVKLQNMSVRNISPIGTLASIDETTRQYFCSKVNASPIVNKYSGQLLYASNELPFQFTENQGVLIKTFLKF